MSQIQFRGATLRYIDVRPVEGRTVCRLHFRSDLSDMVLEEMGWTEPPEQMTGGKFAGSLSAESLVLTPTLANMQPFELQMACEEVGDFQFGVIQGKGDADAPETYLAFTVRSKQLGICAQAENYLASVGTKETALLSVRYSKQAEQLPLAEEAPTDATQEQSEDEPGAIAPAAVAHGNTDQLKKERKKRQKPIAQPGDGPTCVVDGETPPLREHEWAHGMHQAAVRIVDQDGLKALTDIAINGMEVESWETLIEEGPVSIPRVGVAAFGQIEHWCRETAKADGITAERKSALAQLLIWARSQAGEYRQQGRVEAEAVHA